MLSEVRKDPEDFKGADEAGQNVTYLARLSFANQAVQLAVGRQDHLVFLAGTEHFQVSCSKIIKT